MTLTEDELLAIRRDAEDLLPDVATILVRTVEPDGAGGQRETFTPATPTVACRLAPAGGGELRQAGGASQSGDWISDRTTHVLTVPFGVALSEVDRVQVNGATYEVTAVRTRSFEFVRRVEVREAR